MIRAMRTFDIKKLNIDWSDSIAQWPDIWIDLSSKVPVITVAREWARQNTNERRKRLVHEMLHLLGYTHGRIGKYDYNTIPQKDSFSMVVYKSLVRSRK